MSNYNNTIKHSLKKAYNKTFNESKTLSKENIIILDKIRDDFVNENYENFEAYKKILEYDLFDEEYYNSQCEFVPEIDSLLHYIYYGHTLGLNPCELFDTTFYRNFNKNIDENTNPLVYLVNNGMNEGIIKVNKDMWQPLAINRYNLDEKIASFNKYGLNNDYRDKKVIVSLTSYPKRICELKYTIYSLLNQEFKPDKLVLWLSKKEFPNFEEDLPKQLLEFHRLGLTIRWCESIGSYKKLIPSLTEYSDSVIVTADDDLYYPEDWLKKLYNEHLKYPEDIVTHRSRRITFNDNVLDKYLDWKVISSKEDASYLNFFTTGGGVLFPPKTLSDMVFEKDVYDEVCPTCDDIWFWAMAVLNNTKIRVVEDNINEITYVNPARDILFDKETLWSYNQYHNDEQIMLLLERFPQIYEKIINEYNNKKQ